MATFTTESTHQTLAGKIAIVTGASRGLGQGFAFELARRGAKIAGVYTSEKSKASMDELIAKIAALDKPSQCIAIKADLREPSVGTDIVRQTVEAFGPHIDIVVNNAAGEVVKPFDELTIQDYEYVHKINVLGPMLVLQAVKPHLRGPGRIINIGSVGARHGFAGFSLYCSSKAALEGFTRSWAVELGGEGHTVNQVNPGPIQTEMLDAVPAKIVEHQKEWTPIGKRLGNVDDIAPIVCWLASEESRWVTGQVISASGGWAMY